MTSAGGIAYSSRLMKYKNATWLKGGSFLFVGFCGDTIHVPAALVQSGHQFSKKINRLIKRWNEINSASAVVWTRILSGRKEKITATKKGSNAARGTLSKADFCN